MKNTLGISLACYLPWSAYFPNHMIKWASNAGYYFLQVLPFHNTSDLKSNIPVSYLERTWNEGNFWKMIKGRIKNDANSPKIHDILFFPNNRRSEEIFQKLLWKFSPQVIVHSWKDFEASQRTGLLEVSPGMWITPEQIREKIERKNSQLDKEKPLVLDFFHLRRAPRENELTNKPTGIKSDNSLLGKWKNSLEILLPHTSLIHLSPLRGGIISELENFLDGRETEFEEMLVFSLKQGYEGPLIVEASIGLEGLHPLVLKETMSCLYQRLYSIINQFHRQANGTFT